MRGCHAVALGEKVCRHDNVGLKAGWIRLEAKLSSFPHPVPDVRWSSRQGDFWAHRYGLLWNIFDMGRNSATIGSLQAMAIFNQRFWTQSLQENWTCAQSIASNSGQDVGETQRSVGVRGS
jgi:hypothetical protein